MMRTVLRLGVVAAFAAATFLAGAQERVSGLDVLPVRWRNVGPGGGGWIETMTASRHAENRLWIGCDVGGVYLSEDAGHHYVMRNHGLRNLFIETICEHPTNANTVLAGSWGGIYKTMDLGRQWREVRTGLPSVQLLGWGVMISKIIPVPGRPDSFYAAVGAPRDCIGGRGELYRSDDCGESWRQVVEAGQLDTDLVFLDLSSDPRDGETLLAATDRGVFRSADGGRTWRRASDGLPDGRCSHLARSESDPDVIYATVASFPYRSDDGGERWTACSPSGLECGAGRVYAQIAVDPTDPQTVYLGNSDWSGGLWKSTSGGCSWIKVFDASVVQKSSAWLNTWGPDVRSMTVSSLGAHALTFGSAGYVYRTENGGLDWSPRYTIPHVDGRASTCGLEVTCLYDVVPDPHVKGRFYFCYMDIGLFRSDDNGLTVKRLPIVVNDCFDLVCDPSRAGRIRGCFREQSSGKAFLAESLDFGESWRTCGGSGWPTSSVTGKDLVAEQLLPFGEHGLLVRFRDAGLYVSHDDGETICPFPVDGLADAGQVFAMAGEGSRMYVGTMDAVWVSDDETRTWRKLLQIPCHVVCSIDVREDRILVGTKDRPGDFSGKYHGGVWLSEDAGMTWRQVYVDPYVKAVLVTRDYLAAAPFDDPYHDHDNGGGVIVSFNDGGTWQTLNADSLQNWNVACMTDDPFDSHKLWIGTHGHSAYVTRIPEPNVSDPVFVNLAPDETPFWRTATNASFMVGWEAGRTGPAAIQVSGRGIGRHYDDLFDTTLEIGLPEPSDDVHERVYTLNLAREGMQECSARIAVRRQDGCKVRLPGTEEWDRTGRSAVLPVAFGETTLSVGDACAETGLSGAAGWYEWRFVTGLNGAGLIISIL